jgi:uncharacterized protein
MGERGMLTQAMERSRLPPHLSPAEADAIAELVDAARGMLGLHLEQVLLYGSRARGEGNEDSDIDLALIVTPTGRARRNEVYDVAYDIGLRFLISASPAMS